MCRERVMMRGLPLIVLVVFGCDSGTDNDSEQEAGGLIPARATIYDVRITGTTYQGSTSFPSAQTTWFPQLDFDLTGALVIDQTQDRSGANFDNGVNTRDVILVVGSPPGAPQAGAIWLATNTSLYQRVGIGNAAQLAAIDLAFVTVNAGAGSLRFELDGRFNGLPAARTSLLNTFNIRPGIAAGIYQALAGGMELQFSNEGRNIQGVMDVVGGGIVEPRSARTQANIAAVRR